MRFEVVSILGCSTEFVELVGMLQEFSEEISRLSSSLCKRAEDCQYRGQKPLNIVCKIL
jgi:hypothetical protein